MPEELTYNNKAKKETRLTTWFGRFLNKFKYWHLLALALGVIVFGTVYFMFIGHILVNENPEFLNWDDSFFFSLSAFTGMSVNNITPIGWGRFVVVSEAFAGISILAVLIGKIASEHQSAMLRLIYTSDQQRRIVQFTEEVDELKDLIDDILSDHDHDTIRHHAEKTDYFISAISSYLNFQSNQAGLAQKGNETSLRRLYQALNDMSSVLSEAIRLENIDPKAKAHFTHAMQKIWKIGDMMQKWHNAQVTIGILNHLVNNYQSILKWLEDERNNKATYKHRNDLTELLLERVRKAMPPKPWQQGVSKDVAEQLGITNSLISKCIDELQKRNQL